MTVSTGHRCVDVTGGRKVSGRPAHPPPLTLLLEAHLQAGVEDEGGVVQLHGQGREPRARPV